MTKKFSWTVPVIAAFIVLLLSSPSVSNAATTDGANDTVFGENVYVFTDDMDDGDIQEILDREFAILEDGDGGAEFTDHRATFYFMPGEYNVDIDVGFYTHVAGLGQNPDDVVINGSFDVDAQWTEGNGTRNFWRSVENFSVKETANQSKWAVSQAAPMRRMHFDKTLWLWDLTPSYAAGWVSGGYIADSVIDANVLPASQQQFFSRNNNYNKWDGSLWNTVLLGDESNEAPNGLAPYPESTYTIIDEIPVVREKPYLYSDDGEYKLFVPELQENRTGVTWDNGEQTPGTSRSLDDFFIANPSHSDEEINAALDNGKDLIFTPGVYYVDEPIEVNDPNTIVYGFGYPTIIPQNGTTAMKVADIDGVQIAGLLFDAGEVESEQLLEVGPESSSADHAENPISLHDIFFRIGGAHVGRAETSVEINADDVIVDHFWVWRGDHGTGIGWDVNTGDYGLVTNGDDVTMYGLFVEHYQKYQTLWNGENGRVYFYQNEIPYDVPDQASWMSHNGTQNGYAAYKVADDVNNHTLWGAGSYSYFRDADVNLYNSFETPNNDGISMNHMTTVWLNGMAGSEIENVINGIGDNVTSSSDMVANVAYFLGGDDQAPTVPANLTAKALSSNEIELTWEASTDNAGVAEYNIYRDGALVGSTTSTSYNDTGLDATKTYSYTVKAIDAASNESAASNIASAKTTAVEIVLDRTGWTATGTVNGNTTNANNVLDGNLNTNWQSGTAMRPGMFITVDMKAEKTFERVVLDANGSGDYARGYAVYVSNDGTNWGDPVAEGTGETAKIFIDFAEQTARYLKVEQTGTVDPSWWTVNELSVVDYEGSEDPGTEDPVDVTELKNLIITANAIKNDDGTYTTDSFQALQTAISTAEAAVDTVETEAEVTAAVTALQAAIDGLVEDPGTDEPVDRSEWEITTNITAAQGDTAILLDGVVDGRWSSGTPMEPGQYLIVDMKSERTFNQVVLTQQNGDHARAYEIYVSTDGTNWGTPVASGSDIEEANLTIDFTEQTARYVKIVQMATSTSWWSINELDVIYNGEEPVDVSELEALITTAKAISNGDSAYTASSFEALQNAIVAAEAALGTVETDAEVTAAVDALQAAIDGLEATPEPVDVSALENLITTAKAISNGDGAYTASSFEALQNAIVAAEAALGTVETDAEVTAAVDALQAAIDGLEATPEPVDVSALENLITTAKAISNGDGAYTASSFEALQNAIVAAEAALGTVETDAEVTAAVDALQAAIDGLEATPDPVDVSELEDLITTAKAISNGDGAYTASSFEALQNAIVEAEAVLGTVETDAEVTAAVDALQAAIDGLEATPDPVDPEDPEDPKDPVDPVDPEEPGTEEPITEIGTDGTFVEVAAGKEYTISGTNAKVKMPADLPAGTKVKVTKVNPDTTDKGVIIAGDVLEFTFEYPNGETPPAGPFTLVLSYNDDVDPNLVAIYYYNEETGEWEYKGGEVDETNQTITLEVPHFSTYGVFVEAANEQPEDPSDDQDEEDELPDTASGMFNWLLIGIILFAIGAGILVFQYRRRMSN
ncbi:discoidin domain-containing protein [Radiobacillus sp. PE A8.2]|uniref:discoidin domain-containing protein n=1 Tax=Radiobacillus sp. PE A8.2 TaxID=3380349 RepID=UPI00388D538E